MLRSDYIGNMHLHRVLYLVCIVYVRRPRNRKRQTMIRAELRTGRVGRPAGRIRSGWDWSDRVTVSTKICRLGRVEILQT